MAEESQERNAFPVKGGTQFSDPIQGPSEEAQNRDNNTLAAFRNVQKDVEEQQLMPTSVSPSVLDCSGGKSADSVTDAKLYTYRGKKIAGFELQGMEMMCLPQAYETFLKNVIGGLHTVYTKLKRLQIRPIVCNVEQVRALRSLGAIQQGVNRCKLISRDDFDRLYDDCYRIYPRPGRPTKRAIEANWENAPNEKSKKRDFSAEWIFRQNNGSLPPNNNEDNTTAPTYNCLQHYEAITWPAFKKNNVRDEGGKADLKAVSPGQKNLKQLHCNGIHWSEQETGADPLLVSRNAVRSSGVDREQAQVYGTFVPFTAQQLIVQHMMVAAAASQQMHLNDKKMDATSSGQESRESSESSLSSSNLSKSNSPPMAPLNLTKNGSSSNPSESDSDASYERNSSNQSENTLQSEQSIRSEQSSNQNTPTEIEQALQFVLGKLINLIEAATVNFRSERELLENEKSFALKLQGELELKRSQYEKTQRELSREQKKARIFFRRYCKAKRESLELKGKLADLNKDFSANAQPQ